MTSLYVYALLPNNAELPVNLRGFHVEPCEMVEAGELRAVVARQDRERPHPTPENVQAHHDLVVTLRETSPALPVQFGTILPDAGALVSAIAEQQHVFVHDMARLARKVEYGISALWGRRLDDVPRPDLTKERATTSGADYMYRRLAQHQWETRLRELADALRSVMSSHLEHCVEEMETSLLPTMKMPVRAKFLVDATNVECFEAAYRAFLEACPEYRFVVVGPWPPYSFVTTDSNLAPGTRGAEGMSKRS